MSNFCISIIIVVALLCAILTANFVNNACSNIENATLTMQT